MRLTCDSSVHSPPLFDFLIEGYHLAVDKRGFYIELASLVNTHVMSSLWTTFLSSEISVSMETIESDRLP